MLQINLNIKKFQQYTKCLVILFKHAILIKNKLIEFVCLSFVFKDLYVNFYVKV